jgi:hypothetical protein
VIFTVKKKKKKSGTLHEHLNKFFFIVSGDVNSPLKYFCATFIFFTLLTATYSSTIHRESIVFFYVETVVARTRHNIALHVNNAMLYVLFACLSNIAHYTVSAVSDSSWFSLRQRV